MKVKLIQIAENSAAPVETAWDALSTKNKISLIRNASAEAYITPERIGSTLEEIYEAIPETDSDTAAKVIELFKIPEK